MLRTLRAHPRKPHPDSILAEFDYVEGAGAPPRNRESGVGEELALRKFRIPVDGGETRSEAKRRGGRLRPLG